MQFKIDSLATGLTITPIKKHGHARFAGTVIMSNVSFGSVTAYGTLVGEYEQQYPFDTAELPESISKRMRKITADFIDEKTNLKVSSTKVLYAVGKDFYYLP